MNELIGWLLVGLFIFVSIALLIGMAYLVIEDWKRCLSF